MTQRTEALAIRLEQGARALAEFAANLTEEEWQMRVPRDGRKFGVVVHHVASMYPIEIELAQRLAAGEAVAGVSWDDVHAINAAHAREHDRVSKQETLALLDRNARAAAAAIRRFKDAELDSAAPLSLNDDVVLTSQFMLEDHAVRHSYHHLAILQRALAATGVRDAVMATLD
jgi:hypothetical protein